MKVYAVATWDSYYPGANNVEAVFSTREAAYAFSESFRKVSEYDWVDIFEYTVYDTVEEYTNE